MSRTHLIDSECSPPSPSLRRMGLAAAPCAPPEEVPSTRALSPTAAPNPHTPGPPQDHVRDLEYEGDGSRAIDTDMVQLALDELLPPDMHGAVAVSRYMLSQHTQIAAALVKARHSR